MNVCSMFISSVQWAAVMRRATDWMRLNIEAHTRKWYKKRHSNTCEQREKEKKNTWAWNSRCHPFIILYSSWQLLSLAITIFEFYIYFSSSFFSLFLFVVRSAIAVSIFVPVDRIYRLMAIHFKVSSSYSEMSCHHENAFAFKTKC